MKVVTLILFFISCVFSQIHLKGMQKEVHPTGRSLYHMHLETSGISGNSTELYYFYATLYVGDFENPSQQSLIIDTGSGLTCFPCQESCHRCGKHIHNYYSIDKSNTNEVLSCTNNSCTCTADDKCQFSIKYGEGSSYSGYWVKDDVYFGDNYLKGDKQKFKFGCVVNETHLFYTQEADGIMGLAKGNSQVQPIYQQLYEQRLVEFYEFSLCLGKDGGKFSIGGYNESFLIHPDLPVQWTNLTSSSRFYIDLDHVSIGDEKMEGAPRRAMIDSGTTFAYLSHSQLGEVDKVMTRVCSQGDFNCSRYRTKENCYKFSARDHPDKKRFFESFPVFKFVTTNNSTIKWFPSEYFYRVGATEYCLAIDPYGGSSTMVIGGSMMRQNMYIFDIENNRVGVARSRCSEDPDMYIYDDPKYLDPNVRVPNNDNKTEPTIPVEPTVPVEPTEPIDPPVEPIDPPKEVPVEPVEPSDTIPPPIESTVNNTVDPPIETTPDPTSVHAPAQNSTEAHCLNCRPKLNYIHLAIFIVVCLVILLIVACCRKLKGKKQGRVQLEEQDFNLQDPSDMKPIEMVKEKSNGKFIIEEED